MSAYDEITINAEVHTVAGLANSMFIATQIADEGQARCVAAAMLHAVVRQKRLAIEHESLTGQVPLAARGGTRFAPVWVVPALSLGRAWGTDVSAWGLGYESRAFLRLVNVAPDEIVTPVFSTSEGRMIRPERRLRAELPFALDELAEDRVYELLPTPRAGEKILAVENNHWTMPSGSYDGQQERKVLREGWESLIIAYGNAMTTNQNARRAQFAAALERLLWVGEKARKPRYLRPWALLSLQTMVAEVLRASPRRAAAFGLSQLRAHPQCYPSLIRKLKKV